MRPGARLLIALALVGGVGTPAPGAPPGPPSVFEERPSSGATGQRADPALRQRFLTEYRGIAADARRKVLDAWIPRLGVTGLLDALEEGFPSCHDHAHELGKAAYAASRDMAGVLQACQTRCVSGCMHGVLMEAFTERPGALRDRIATLCDGAAFRQIHKKGDCVHGVGHGVAYVSDYDVPRALALCEAVGDRAYQYYCASGAYMQLFMTFQRQISARADHYPCDEAKRFAAACYRYKVFFMLGRAATQGKGPGDGVGGVPRPARPRPARVLPRNRACQRRRGRPGAGADPRGVREGSRARPVALHPGGRGEARRDGRGGRPARVRRASRRNADVCREAARNKLYGTRKIGLEHYFVGR